MRKIRECWIEIVVALTLLIIMLAVMCGCSGLPAPVANDPSEFIASRVTESKPDGTKVEREEVKYRGPGNETRSAPFAWRSMKVGAAVASAANLDLSGIIDSTPVFIIGGVLLTAGAAAFWFGERGLAVVLWIIGGCVMALPFVAETLRWLLMVGGLLAMAGGGLYLVLTRGKKLRAVVAATGPDAQAKLKAKGDKAGAAAAAYVGAVAKGKPPEVAKVEAKAVSQ